LAGFNQLDKERFKMSRQYKIRGSVGSTLTIPVDYQFYNWTAAASLFSDAACTIPATATGGAINIKGVIPGAAEAATFDSSPVDPTDKAAYASAGAPLESVTITFDAIVGATHAIVVITGTGG
jgi:ABC-type phosphate transport system substrate-binding protein